MADYIEGPYRFLLSLCPENHNDNRGPMTLDDLKDKLRQRLIETDGHPTPYDLRDLIEEAKELGLDDRQLVPEVDRTINWEHIRAEKAKEEERRKEEEAKAAARQKEIDEAPEYLDALISYCMADGIVEGEELRTIFGKATELEQSLFATATKIKGLLDKGKFKPFPNADLNANGLHEVLMSTNWYTEKTHPQPTPPAPPKPQQDWTYYTPPPPPEPPRIHLFSTDKTEIKKGEAATLRWHVSGVERVAVSGLGTTTVLNGEQRVKPETTTTYVMTAGSLQQELSISVVSPKKPMSFWKYLFIVAVLAALIRACG